MSEPITFTLPIPDLALAPGTRVSKGPSCPADAHQQGALGRVIEWYRIEGHFAGYMVEWDDLPGVPVYVGPIAGRLKPEPEIP